MSLVVLHNKPYQWDSIVDQANILCGGGIISQTNIYNISSEDFVLPLNCYDSLPDCYLIGNRIYNRLQRMRLMETLKIDLVKWAPITEILNVFDLWKNDKVLFKSDGSHLAQGVFVKHKTQNIQRINGNVSGDILMDFINDPSKVLKVYFLHDVIVSSYVWNLPSAADKDFKKIVHDSARQAALTQVIYELPYEANRSVHMIMQQMKKDLMGLCSVDFMLYNNKWCVIELNTSGVGTGIFSRIDPNWSVNFSKGLASLSKDISNNKTVEHLKFKGMPYRS